MFNKVIIDGRLTDCAELKTSKSGKSVTLFTIAVDRPYQKDKETETDFLTVVAWNKTAEFICRNFTKGSRIAVEGSIRTRKYEDKNGNKRMAFEILADEVHIIDFAKREEKVETNEEPVSMEDLPF